MHKLIMVIAVLTLASQTLAATPEERATMECKQIIEQNFQAINEENLKALLATCSVHSGTAEQGREFVAQTKEMFEETNVYMSLTGFEMIKVVPPRAYAWVTQRTIAQRPEDHKPKNPGLNYRHHSGLLPEYEEVRYKQRFNFEGGEWKVHRVVSAPEPVNGSKRLVVESAPRNCPNGKCSMPFVTVR